jgi:aspartyl-tRNA(Asn)/glutamyl-tRNA(Gln) amidotransferase subunit A
MANIVNLKRPIVELAAEVQSGKVSAVSLVEASLERLEETRDYHTYLELNEHALEQAAEIDKRIAVGETVGPLAGVPYLAKDNFLTTGTHTTAASHILEPFKAPYQAVAIERLEQAGAIMMGKATLDRARIRLTLNMFQAVALVVRQPRLL